MDLFEDLPEPGNKKDNSNSVPQLNSWGSSDVDIFSDLPVPTAVSENRGVKRKSDEENGKECCQEEEKNDLYIIQGYSAEKKGEREEMQDFHVLLEDFHKQIPELHPSVTRLSYYAVFDGHGGIRASKFAANHLHVNLAQKFPKGIHSVPV